MYRFKNLANFTEGGNPDKENQDYSAIAENYAVVLDGATGLVAGDIVAGRDDVAWFVEEFYKNLKKLLNKDKALPELVKAALIKTNKRYHSYEKDIHPDIYPSAGICVIKIIGDSMEVFILGDCQLAVKFKNGKIKHFQVDKLKKLDAVNIKKMALIAKQRKINVSDARQLINDDLIATRRLMNTEQGYYILSEDENAVQKGFYEVLALENIKSILGCTDGFSQIFDTFHCHSLKTVFTQLEKGKTLTELNDVLKILQEKDSSCNKYPRFKKRDDSSAFYAEIHNVTKDI